ncbi:hypothetical protein D3C73_1170220 [compost metagenome]
MDTAPGQLQVGDLAPDLVGLDHHDHFASNLCHDTAQSQQFIERGSATDQIDAVGTDEQLVEIVGA